MRERRSRDWDRGTWCQAIGYLATRRLASARQRESRAAVPSMYLCEQMFLSADIERQPAVLPAPESFFRRHDLWPPAFPLMNTWARRQALAGRLGGGSLEPVHAGAGACRERRCRECDPGGAACRGGATCGAAGRTAERDPPADRRRPRGLGAVAATWRRSRPRYSKRSALTASMPAARRAGTRQARRPTRSSTPVTTPIVSGSVG